MDITDLIKTLEIYRSSGYRKVIVEVNGRHDLEIKDIQLDRKCDVCICLETNIDFSEDVTL